MRILKIEVSGRNAVNRTIKGCWKKMNNLSKEEKLYESQEIFHELHLIRASNQFGGNGLSHH